MRRRKTKIKKKKVNYTKLRAAQMAEALDYAVQGHTPETISEAMKLPVAIIRELIESGLAKIEHYTRRTELQMRRYRINQIITHHYQRAIDGDKDALTTIRMLEQERTTIDRELEPRRLGFFGSIRSREIGETGQPPHEPTAETISIVQALTIMGAPQERIAHYIGLSEPTLVKHYGEFMDGAMEKRMADCENFLFNHIANGNLAALIFAMKTQGRRAAEPRWLDRSDEGRSAEDSFMPDAPRIVIRGGLPSPDLDDQVLSDAMMVDPTEDVSS